MWCDREGNERGLGLVLAHGRRSALRHQQAGCGTPDQRGAKKGSVLSAQVHCLPRHHFPDQEASIPPPPALSANPPTSTLLAPLPLIISRQTKHILTRVALL